MKKHSLLIGLADQCQPELNSMGRNYAAAVRRGGHVPVILPYTTDAAQCTDMLRAVDLLLLCGGGDIASWRFGQEASPLAGVPNHERDGFELLLFQHALQLRLPVVGICRGLQLINVALGGTLHQDIGDALRAVHQRPDSPFDPVHPVEVDPDSRLFDVLQQQHIQVNSTHHQAIDQLGRSLHVTARALDGTVEAVESFQWPVAAVQWHPERLFAQDILWQNLLAFATLE